MITSNLLHEMFSYDENTGHLTWKIRPANRVKLGDAAGYVNNNGYRMVRVLDKTYCTHRIIWFYVYGKWPTGNIDHINGIRTDNRIINLRDVTANQNMQNQRMPHKNSYSGVLGVDFCKQSNKWRARIMVNGESIFLGKFDELEDANNSYKNAKNKYHHK